MIWKLFTPKNQKNPNLNLPGSYNILQRVHFQIIFPDIPETSFYQLKSGWLSLEVARTHQQGHWNDIEKYKLPIIAFRKYKYSRKIWAADSFGLLSNLLEAKPMYTFCCVPSTTFLQAAEPNNHRMDSHFFSTRMRVAVLPRKGGLPSVVALG